MKHIPHLRVSGNSLEVLKKGRWHYVDSLENITFIRSLYDYVVVHCKDSKKITTLMTTKDVAGMLQEKKFLRIHRQYIVNLDGVQEYDKSTLYMKTGKTFPIGKTYKKSIKGIVPQKKREKKQLLRIAA